jgi:hypothetical protein
MVESIVYGIDHLHQVSLTDPSFVTKYQMIYTKAVSERAKSFPQLIDSLGFLVDLKTRDISSLEIFGAWEEFCVAEGVLEALSLGLNVDVHKGYVAALKKREMSFRDLIALKLEGKIFGYTEDDQCHYFVAPPGKNTKL